MRWRLEFHEEAKKDMKRLDGSQRIQVLKALDKVIQDPTPTGYGKALGNAGGINLTGLFKIKLRNSGIRIVYQLVYEKESMKIIVIGMRSDNEVYREAAKRVS